MKKILMLHSWFGTPTECWFPDSKIKLEQKGYQVTIPFLKDNEKPTLADWKKSALENFTIDEETSIIGHSLGSVLALRLAEDNKMDKLVLTAVWDFWDLTPEHETFLNHRINHQKIIDNCKEIVVVLSDNDPYMTQISTEDVAKRLHAKTVFVKGGGHFTEKDGFLKFPEVVNLF